MKANLRFWIGVLAVLNILAIGYIVASRHMASVAQQADDQARAARLASAMNFVGKSNIMRPDEFLGLQEIKARTKQTGKIDDADMDWAIRLMNLRGAQGPDANNAAVLRGVARLYVHELFYTNSISYTPAQRDKVFHDVVEECFAHHDDPNAVNDRIAAARILARTQDKRGIPLLLPMLNEHNPNAVRVARKSLTALGYSIPSP